MYFSTFQTVCLAKNELLRRFQEFFVMDECCRLHEMFFLSELLDHL